MIWTNIQYSNIRKIDYYWSSYGKKKWSKIPQAKQEKDAE